LKTNREEGGSLNLGRRDGAHFYTKDLYKPGRGEGVWGRGRGGGDSAMCYSKERAMEFRL